jgi:tetratricopeptide (TPR) repeat protein
MNKNDASAINALAYACVLGGDPEGGLAYYLTAYGINPNEPTNYAGWCYYQIGEYDKAAERAALNMKADPKNSIYYVDMANVTNALELYDYTAHYSEKALNISPGLDFAYKNIIEAEMAQGNYDKVSQMLNRFIATDKNKDAYAQKGILKYRLNEFDSARIFLDHYISADFVEEGEDEASLNTLYLYLEYRAITDIALGNEPEGRKQLEDIIDRVNTHLHKRPGKYFLLAGAYAMLGDKEESLNNLGEAERLGYNLYSNYLTNDLLEPIREEPRYKEILQTVKNRVMKMRERVLKSGILDKI